MAISPETREVLRFHILKLSALPVGASVTSNGVQGIIPGPNEENGWQVIGLKKDIAFKPDREHRTTTIRIQGLNPSECREFKKEAAYLDGVSAYRVGWKISVTTGAPELQFVFRVTEGSMALRAEDIPYLSAGKGVHKGIV